MSTRFEPAGPLGGVLRPPPDKSISHRAALIAAMAEGRSLVLNYLDSADTRSTLAAVRCLGARIEEEEVRDGELELAITSVARGETYLSPAAAKHVIGGYREQAIGAVPAADAQAQERLTARQREILQLIAEGRTTKQIAQVLTLSAKTVEMHRAQLMERLDIHDVAGLVRYALRTGIISGDS